MFKMFKSLNYKEFPAIDYLEWKSYTLQQGFPNWAIIEI